MNTDKTKDLLALWFHYDRIQGRDLLDNPPLFQHGYDFESLLRTYPEFFAATVYLDGINDAIVLSQTFVTHEAWTDIKTTLLNSQDFVRDSKGRVTFSERSKGAILNALDSSIIDKYTDITFRIFVDIATQALQVLRTAHAFLGRRFFVVEKSNLLLILDKYAKRQRHEVLSKLVSIIADVIIETGIFQEYDSLISDTINTLKKYPEYEPDIERLYLKLGIIYERKGELDQALSVYDEALHLSENRGDYTQVANRFVDLGNIYRRLNKSDKALKLFDKALSVHRKSTTPDLKSIGYAFRQKGKLYLSNRDFSNAEECFKNELEIGRQLEDKRSMIGALSNLANLYTQQRANLKALDLYQRALEIAREIEDLPTIAYQLKDIGQTLIYLGRLKDSLLPLKESMTLLEKAGDFYTMSISLRTLATAYERLCMWDDAVFALDKSIRYAEKLGIDTMLNISIRQLGQLLIKKGALEEAISALTDALSRFEKQDDKKSIQMCIIDLGRAYLAKNDFDEAETQFKKAIEINKRINNQIGLYRAMDFLARTYMEWKKYDKAFDILYSAIEMQSKSDDSRHALDVLYKLGELLLIVSKADKAIDVYSKIREALEKSGQPKEIANIYYKLGISYLKAKKYRDAVFFFIKSQDIYDGLKWSRKVEVINQKLQRLREILGKVAYEEINSRYKKERASYFMLTEKAAECEFVRDFEQACQYYKKAINYLESHRTEEDWHTKFNEVHLLYGTALKKAQRWQEAIQVQKETFRLFRADRNYAGMARTYFEIGNVFHIMNDFEQARLYYKDSFRLFQRSYRERNNESDLFMSALVKESLGMLEFYLFMFHEAREDLELSAKIFLQLGNAENVRRIEKIINLMDSFKRKRRSDYAIMTGEV